jgi:hypothetical protein
MKLLRVADVRMGAQDVVAISSLYKKIIHTYPQSGVQSTSCREANQVSSKLGAGIIIKGILGLTIDQDTIPYQEGGLQQTQAPNTIVNAETVYSREKVNIEEEGEDRLH